MPTAKDIRLDAARVRRESLYQALIGLEDALSTPIGDGERWRLRVAMAVDHAVNRVAEHVESSESDDGLLVQVAADSPRLRCRIDRLKSDHDQLEKDAHQLSVALADLSDADVPARGPQLRNQALEFLGLLASHRQRGADLVYEAYQVDIGGDH
ncbi:MAG: hypothetical protein AAFN30_05580 [Actinomycetota bacterium]